MIRKFVLSLLLAAATAHNDESCRTECYSNKMPMCGTWLTNEDNAGAAGTYELNSGIVNMTCEFSSLPEPANVIWVHKAENTNSWLPFPCSTKLENKVCGDTEHKVQSRCILRTSDVNMSGSYRCQAIAESPISENSKAYGSEFSINVVGISSVRVQKYSLKFNQLGHITVEVCANPKPEVYWLTKDAIVTPHQATHRVAASHLLKHKIRSSEDGPATVVPYCYISEVLIRSVHADDDFQLLVKTDDRSRIAPLNLKVTEIPSSSAAYSFLSFQWKPKVENYQSKMNHLIYSSIFGCCLLIMCFFSTIVLSITYRLAVRTRGSIYVIVTGHIAADCIILISYLIYLIPISLTDTYLFPGGKDGVFGEFFMFLLLASWNYTTLCLILMAFNRYLVICCQAHELSTKWVICCKIMIAIFCFFTSSLAQFVTPCCKLMINKSFASHEYIFIDGIINYSSRYVNMPLNITSSITCFILYSMIFIYLRRSRQKIAYMSRINEMGAIKERKYFAIQFSFLSLFHFLEYSALRLAPLITFNSFAMSLPAVFLSLNAFMNTFILLVFNKEVQSNFKDYFKYCFKKNRTNTATIFTTTSVRNNFC